MPTERSGERINKNPRGAQVPALLTPPQQCLHMDLGVGLFPCAQALLEPLAKQLSVILSGNVCWIKALPKPLDSHQLCCLIQLGLHSPIYYFSPLSKPRQFHCTTLPWRGNKHTIAGLTPVKPEYLGYITATKSTVRLGI